LAWCPFFLLFRYVGDPIKRHGRPGHARPEEREELRTKLGLNDPAPGPVLPLSSATRRKA